MTFRTVIGAAAGSLAYTVSGFLFDDGEFIEVAGVDEKITGLEALVAAVIPLVFGQFLNAVHVRPVGVGAHGRELVEVEMFPGVPFPDNLVVFGVHFNQNVAAHVHAAALEGAPGQLHVLELFLIFFRNDGVGGIDDVAVLQLGHVVVPVQSFKYFVTQD